MPVRLRNVPEEAFSAVQRTLAGWAQADRFSLTEPGSLDPPHLSTALPHRVRVVAWEDVRRTRRLLRSEAATSWRFLIAREGEAKVGAGFEVVAAATAVPNDDGTFGFGDLNRGAFVAGTVDAVRQAEELLEDSEADYEPVFLVVPAAYVVALWLQRQPATDDADDLGDGDLFIAIPPSNPAMPTGVPMTTSSFIAALQEAQ
jgi:hypothetical protein